MEKAGSFALIDYTHGHDNGNIWKLESDPAEDIRNLVPSARIYTGIEWQMYCDRLDVLQIDVFSCKQHDLVEGYCQAKGIMHHYYEGTGIENDLCLIINRRRRID